MLRSIWPLVLPKFTDWPPWTVPLTATVTSTNEAVDANCHDAVAPAANVIPIVEHELLGPGEPLTRTK